MRPAREPNGAHRRHPSPPSAVRTRGTGRWPVPIPSDFVPASVAPAGSELVEGRRVNPVAPRVFGSVLMRLSPGAEVRAFSGKVDSDLGFTRDRQSTMPKSAIADLGGFPQKMRPNKESRERSRVNPIGTRSRTH